MPKIVKIEGYSGEFMVVQPVPALMRGMIADIYNDGRALAVNPDNGMLTVTKKTTHIEELQQIRIFLGDTQVAALPPNISHRVFTAFLSGLKDAIIEFDLGSTGRNIRIFMVREGHAQAIDLAAEWLRRLNAR